MRNIAFLPNYTASRLYIFYIYLFTAIGLLPGGSGYFTCKQNMKLVWEAQYYSCITPCTQCIKNSHMIVNNYVETAF